MKPSVYLAGPITGLTYGDSTDWREYATALLGAFDIQGWSPMRAKGYLAKLGPLLKTNYQGIHPLSEPQGILARDRNDVIKCDLVIANMLGAERVSIGTVMEIAWADAFRTPVILVMERPGATTDTEGRTNVHDHEMVTGSVGWITDTLEDAVEIAKAVLLPDAHGNPLEGT